jgi:flagellar basal-body rod modification protein FlgD
MSVESITSGATPPAELLGSQSQALDRADFLRMLTTQLRSQDPLSPMSNEEFATQLATFSSVQELQSIGATLYQSLQANLLMGQVFNNTMATSLIGKVVRAQADSVEVGSSGPVNLNYSLAGNATDITIDITDSDGNVVRTLTVPPQAAGEHQAQWDGLDSDGQRVPAGTYTFAVNAKNADGGSVGVSTYLEGVVSEVRYVNGQVVLMVDGREVSLADVLLIRNDDGEAKKG